ncbi:MAG: DUF2079 domain-containing protein [Candidatus Omnitrophica bacterium]|nr:DUF2079 domain-containing protein [Candidatus Omnitrophota bacterium]
MKISIPKIIKSLNSFITSADKYAISFCMLSLLSWTAVIIFKYYHFGYNDWDLAFYSQGLWNILRGSTYTSLAQLDFFAEHTSFIVAALIWIYALIQHPLTLVFLKIISYIAGAFLLYKITEEDLGKLNSIILMAMYFIFPPNVYSILYDFNFEGLAPVLLFLMFYYFKRDRYAPFLICSLFLISIKENMPLLVATFGITALFSKNKNNMRWGFIPLFASLAIFVLFIKIIPMLRHSPEYPHLSRYLHLGSNYKEIAETLFFNPVKLWGVISDPERINFTLELCGPLLIPAFLSIHILFLASPIFLQHFLSSYWSEHTIVFYYSATIVPFIFLAAANTIRVIKRLSKPVAANVVVIVLLLFSIFQFSRYLRDFINNLDYHMDNMSAARWEILRKVPKTSATITTFCFLPELSTRKSLYAFIDIYSDWSQNIDFIQASPTRSGKEAKAFVLPAEVDHALIDFSDTWLTKDAYANPAAIPRMQKFFFDPAWSVEAAANYIVLLRKNIPDGKKLIETSDKPFSEASFTPPIIMDNKFSLVSAQIGEAIKGKGVSVPITFNWNCLEQIPDRYLIRFLIQGKSKSINTAWREVGYIFYPTDHWMPNNFIKENYWLWIPDLEPGEYTLSFGFWNNNKQKDVIIRLGGSELSSLSNPIILGTFQVN